MSSHRRVRLLRPAPNCSQSATPGQARRRPPADAPADHFSEMNPGIELSAGGSAVPQDLQLAIFKPWIRQAKPFTAIMHTFVATATIGTATTCLQTALFRPCNPNAARQAHQKCTHCRSPDRACCSAITPRLRPGQCTPALPSARASGLTRDQSVGRSAFRPRQRVYTAQIGEKGRRPVSTPP